jgi:hypothetical protein
MNDPRDDDLREAFDALGRDLPTSIPSFADLTSTNARNAARRRSRNRRIAIVAAVILPVAFILRPGANNEPDFERFAALTGIDPGQVTWQAPSDFLLDVPSRDLLRRVPFLEIHAPALAPDSARPPDSNATKRRSSS